jgi:glutaredoxin
MRYSAVVSRVVLYSRTVCGLCDEAREVLESVRRDAPFELEEVLVDGDDDLESRYGLRVPVVLVDGQEEFEIAVDPARLRSLLGA